MKKILLVLILLTGIHSAFAQIKRKAPLPVTNKDSVQSNREFTDKVSRKEIWQQLNLTQEQKGKIKAIKQESKTQKEAVQNDEKLSQEEKQSRLKEIKKQTALKVAAILTDEQKVEWKKLKEQQRGKQKNAIEMKEDEKQMGD